MKGIIGLEQYRISCIIGAYPEERAREQEIVVDLKVRSCFAKCAKTDHIDDTIDYEKLARLCSELAINKQYKLLESFAYDVLDILIKEFQVEWAWIKIWKPKAFQSVDYTYVELEQGAS